MNRSNFNYNLQAFEANASIVVINPETVPRNNNSVQSS
jgi:hypothetical protein